MELKYLKSNRFSFSCMSKGLFYLPIFWLLVNTSQAFDHYSLMSQEQMNESLNHLESFQEQDKVKTFALLPPKQDEDSVWKSIKGLSANCKIHTKNGKIEEVSLKKSKKNSKATYNSDL